MSFRRRPWRGIPVRSPTRAKESAWLGRARRPCGGSPLRERVRARHRSGVGARRKGMRAIGTRTQSLLVAIALMVADTAWAQSFGAVDPSVKVEWHVEAKSHPIVWGYIYNQRPRPATRVRILIEQLDGEGKSLSSRTVWVTTVLSPFGREYFEERVPTADATYRVSISSIEWSGGGAGM
jgi:hypothetical protein